MPSMNELEIVEWLRAQQVSHPHVKVGIGDDMAVLQCSTDQMLLSCDFLLDGVHFDTARHKPEEIGRKAVACSLSDCAAMAVRPVGALMSVALPAKFSTASVQGLFRGALSIAAEYDVAIIGGDTTRWGHPLAVDVTIAAVAYEGIAPVTRGGARPGDAFYVTGPLGGSNLAKHMTFTPRVREARDLAATLQTDLHAMMDISDGLALDLWRMCKESNVGAILDERQLQAVVSEEARLAGEQDERSAVDHALTDGEDYELLLAVGGVVAKSEVDLYAIGITTESELLIRRLDGRLEQLEPRGFIH